jgi:hypothetical protein
MDLRRSLKIDITIKFSNTQARKNPTLHQQSGIFEEPILNNVIQVIDLQAVNDDSFSYLSGFHLEILTSASE